jgi:hypothetical protein
MDIVLIAGLWLGGSVWGNVAARLEARGHRAVPVTLPGQGDGNVSATNPGCRGSESGTVRRLPGMSRGSEQVLAIYRRALPRVYGYLLPRCGNTALAEDLTAETFLASRHEPGS